MDRLTLLAETCCVAALAGCMAGLPIEPASMQARCEPVLRALRLARAQPQVSQYLVDHAMQPLADQPSAFRIGDLVHETDGGRMVTRHWPTGHDPLVTRIERALAAGQAWCGQDGTQRVHGQTWLRLQFLHPEVPAHYQPVTLLVEPTSGLPMWHGYTNLPGGFVWVYGPQRPAPPRHRGAGEL